MKKLTTYLIGVEKQILPFLEVQNLIHIIYCLSNATRIWDVELYVWCDCCSNLVLYQIISEK